MYYALYYHTAQKTALKRFKGITNADLYMLDIIRRENRPCGYRRLNDLLQRNEYNISHKLFSDVIARCVTNGYLSRARVAGNSLYELTTTGKELLLKYCSILEQLVKQDIARYGNGFKE